MARAENVQTISATAGEALPIYRCVALQADGKYDLVGTDDRRADGVTAEAVAADGDTFALAPCSQPAIMKCEAEAAIFVGDLVAAAVDGKVKTAADANAGLYSIGVALTAAAADGDIIEVQLHLSANQA